MIICVFAVSRALFAQEVGFHGFVWGTNIETFTKKVGNPVSTSEYDGLKALIYDNIVILEYPVFMIVYFSKDGLEGGTYYFHTFSLEELMKCYTEVQQGLLERFGPTRLCDRIIREMRPYETSWELQDGYVYLKVNTRQNEPVTLWYSSPALTKKVLGS